MKIKEYELFRAYYCGVCRSIGKHHGQLRRLTLSYDTAFLAVLLSAAAGERLSVRKKRCVLHPLEKEACYRRQSCCRLCLRHKYHTGVL